MAASEWIIWEVEKQRPLSTPSLIYVSKMLIFTSKRGEILKASEINLKSHFAVKRMSSLAGAAKKD